MEVIIEKTLMTALLFTATSGVLSIILEGENNIYAKIAIGIFLTSITIMFISIAILIWI